MGKLRSIVEPTRKAKSKTAKATARVPVLTPKQQARAKGFHRYLARCMADESGEQEETWSILQKVLDENRTSTRKHFND
jgi:hypothetical protein